MRSAATASSTKVRRKGGCPGGGTAAASKAVAHATRISGSAAGPHHLPFHLSLAPNRTAATCPGAPVACTSAKCSNESTPRSPVSDNTAAKPDTAARSQHLPAARTAARRPRGHRQARPHGLPPPLARGPAAGLRPVAGFLRPAPQALGGGCDSPLHTGPQTLLL